MDLTVIEAIEVNGEKTLPLQDVPDAWIELFGGRGVAQLALCEFGLAEEVIGWIKYADGHNHVIIVESLRPSISLYEGKNSRTAELLFWAGVTEHTRDM